ncbi:hypothetical protein KCP78_21785 [Salmonella enterica subsp. enterica]|nr:hypothetical protein KCP78_21785 [Salmonella enterica subsp. enterica]
MSGSEEMRRRAPSNSLRQCFHLSCSTALLRRSGRHSPARYKFRSTQKKSAITPTPMGIPRVTLVSPHVEACPTGGSAKGDPVK